MIDYKHMRSRDPGKWRSILQILQTYGVLRTRRKGDWYCGFYRHVGPTDRGKGDRYCGFYLSASELGSSPYSAADFIILR